MATFLRLKRTLALIAASLPLLLFQPAGFSQPAGQLPGANIGRGQPPNATVGNGPLGQPPAGNANNGATATNGGGAAMADFDSLIDLITSTVENESWLENGTGEGEIQPFPNGVYVDAAGALKFRAPSKQAGLASVRTRGLRSNSSQTSTVATAASVDAKPQAPSAKSKGVDDDEAARVRKASELRFVSLSKLEAAIVDCQQRHLPLDPAMLSLAGLQRVSYVFAYPETGDLVLAGPAGDWAGSPQGGLVSLETGRPVVRLDDLLTLWRRQRSEKSTAFGCSIVPRQEALAQTQGFLDASAAKPLEPSGRRKWLAELRDTLGIQDVEYYNIDEGSRIASLLLAADYHMKLIGMGLAEGVPGVKSYLATVRNGADGSPPPMAVLRWWFSMPASTVEASDAHDAFAMPQRCICVLSENEMLAARGERVHTGQSEDLNRQFAESFTQEFDALALKYPVYGELERVFEVALALAVIEREGLTEKVGWSPDLLLDEQRLRLPSSPAPKAVETVVNHRIIGGRQIIAGVSGGVWVDGGKSVQVTPVAGQAIDELTAAKKEPVRAAMDEAAIVWWWD